MQNFLFLAERMFVHCAQATMWPQGTNMVCEKAVRDVSGLQEEGRRAKSARYSSTDGRVVLAGGEEAVAQLCNVASNKAAYSDEYHR